MLNPAKCVFGVPASKLLGLLVSNRGIEANPEKIKAITSLAKPVCINDVQRLAGRITALSRLGEKAMPLYQMMKKTDDFVWSDAADSAFEDMKRPLAEPPVLAAPIEKEPLLLYVAANSRAVSVAIVVECKEIGKEYPVRRPVTMSVRCSLNLNKDIRTGRSLFMGCSWQDGSLNTIFRVTQSLC